MTVLIETHRMDFFSQFSDCDQCDESVVNQYDIRTYGVSFADRT